jgi:signal transduction histidine kinase
MYTTNINIMGDKMVDIHILKDKLGNAVNSIKLSKNNIEINLIVENIIKEITDAEYASVWMHDSLMLLRERKEGVREISMSNKEGLLYKCFVTKQAGIYNYLSSEKGYVSTIDNPDKIKMKSKIMIPLMRNDEFIGIVTAYSSVKKVKKFTKDDLAVFQAIIPFVIDAVYKMRMNSKEDVLIERRTQGSIDNGLRRRQNDTMKNLDKLEEARTDTKNEQEMLEYVSNIVHDIRTPANGLLGFLEILEEQIKDARIKEYISHARSSAMLINTLTTSILDGVSAKREPDNKGREIVNTIKFFADIGEVFSANLYKKKICYNIFIDPTVPKEITIDTMRVKRVVMNLISNAVKFTSEEGSIEFSVRYKQKEKKLHIFVKDNGIGIAKEKQKDIFEAFKQAEENTKDIYGGTGLGLSICAGYVKELGGELLIDSELDRGSIFYFDIPLDIQDNSFKFQVLKNENIQITMLLENKNTFVANHIARYLVKIGISSDKLKAIHNIENIQKKDTHIIIFESKLNNDVLLYARKHNMKVLVVEENLLTLNTNSIGDAMLISQYGYFGETLYSFASIKHIPKVLIVEDDRISTVLLKTMLKDEYCEVDIVNNGEEGLRTLTNALEKNIPYDIVYTDHNMPLLTGSEMLRRYEAIEKKKSALQHTIKVSISGDLRDKEELFDFDFYATKPFKKEEIVSVFLKTH